MGVIDTIKCLERLEALVEESFKVMGFYRFDEEEFYMLVNKIRASLPEDLRKAGKITQNSEKITLAAQSEAEQAVEAGRAEAAQIVQEARARAQALAEQSEIARIASAQAREIVAQAEAEARDLRVAAENYAGDVRAGADEYAHDVLGDLEDQVGQVLRQVEGRVSGMLTTIQRGRAKLDQRSGRPAQEFMMHPASRPANPVQSSIPSRETAEPMSGLPSGSAVAGRR